MKLIFLGSPGAGKGTQAEILSKRYSIPKLSTGDLLRQEISQKTELGLKLKQLIESGELVSDDIMISLVGNILSSKKCESGYILDGFPRTIEQGRALDEMLSRCGSLDVSIVYFDISEEEVVTRVSGRLTCADCGAGYHREFLRPKVDGVCDRCGSRNLISREDDSPQAVIKRLKVYNELTRPLLDYYKDQGRLLVVNAMLPINEITNNVVSLVESNSMVVSE